MSSDVFDGRGDSSVGKFILVAEKHQVYKKGTDSEKLCRCGNAASLCVSTTTTAHICRIGILLTVDPTRHYLNCADVGDEDENERTRNRNRPFPAAVVSIEEDAKAE